ncbi:glucosaminidase domain-containing protein [Ferrovibrio sp.]|uniref:glucosaminidase domain-containing protein n=1 Tax=Ferrovibrio sp. TaxID=1917215 RepID=UPI003D2D2B4C
MTAESTRSRTSDRSLLGLGSDVRLILAGVGMLVGVGLASGVGVGVMSAHIQEARAPEVEAQPVMLRETVQEAWERLTHLAQLEWRLPVTVAVRQPQPERVPAPERNTAEAQPQQVAGLPLVPPEIAAKRLAEAKALSPHRTAIRADAERTVDAMLRRFETEGFDLADLRSGGPSLEVPRIFLARLPIDIADVNLTEKRKRAFIKVMLPHILRENERIADDREKLLKLQERRDSGLPLRPRDEAWLADLSQRYGLDEADLDEMLLRVDMIPPALALAQSIEESGWGTSRFALLGNAVYGQWTWNPGSGIVPENRPDGEKYEILRFSSLEHSVAAYMRNLNSKSSYREFRDQRSKLRQRDMSLDGYSLAGHLHRYSVRGADYVRTLRSIMRTNDLEMFDSSRLSDEPPPVFSGLDFFSKG